jgi:hypothetical protein
MILKKKLLSGDSEQEAEQIGSNLSDRMALAVSILLPILFFILMKAISR